MEVARTDVEIPHETAEHLEHLGITALRDIDRVIGIPLIEADAKEIIAEIEEGGAGGAAPRVGMKGRAAPDGEHPAARLTVRATHADHGWRRRGIEPTEHRTDGAEAEAQHGRGAEHGDANV